MEKIKIFNKRTFIKRLYNYLGLSVVVLGTYACSLQISELFRDRGFDKRTRIVEKAVSNGEIELASVLLDSFGEKGLLRLEDKIILNQQIERNKDRYEINNQKLRNINRLEGFLTIKNLDSAYVALKQITSTGLFNSGEISDLQNKIYQHTQQGFFEKLASSADRGNYLAF